jgi:hypothetical protein
MDRSDIRRTRSPKGTYFTSADGLNIEYVTAKSTNRYIAIGRLFALSIMDQLPLGFSIPLGLARLLGEGKESIGSHIAYRLWPDTFLPIEYSREIDEIVDSVKTGKKCVEVSACYFVSVENRALGGFEKETKLSTENIEAWKLYASDYIVYGRFKMDYDAFLNPPR